ncbi:ribosome maturation factor RimM [Paenilisteria rocourtiae]|uniref:Ribosome maturation factor RimM n=1 Tax=Listeria rocourtiae TaxID=647910 RepID=A0A4V3DQ80_9LIST|nr:ribosome maturation factor RimM [Listeria rocourtiae]EUJ44353.1 16S rRNA-processing protein RimM [Listeria rocourtiae FSL F6-920]MBC1603548.1 ribosome maturation factor RimM [Listeria rocourtiae]TDR55166.1 16S rRNA processing protein RimM [Listeria rocourtiae]
MEQMFNVGKIVNTHGLMGEVRVISQTDFADERFAQGNELFLFAKGSKKPEKLIIKTHRKHKNFDLLTFEGIIGINNVERMRDGMLKVPESQLGELEENEYYFHEIVGCEVYTEKGELLGEISEILTPGANDVWVVQMKGQKDKLVPYIADVVKSVNTKDKKITISVMEGLFD